MSTNTPNYNLSVPDDTDAMSATVQAYRDNLVIIDNNLGGGGGGGGDTFIYGTFINPNSIIYDSFVSDGNEHTWTATDDCIIGGYMDAISASASCYIAIDGLDVFIAYGTHNGVCLPVMKGQTISYKAKSGSSFKAFGIYQGTHGIFAPVIYSDNERMVGVWRDNKPLYAKTINFGSLPNNTEKSVAHGITDVEKIWIAGGYVSTGTKQYELEHASSTAQDMWTSNVDATNVYIETFMDRTSLNAFVVVYYTKTTDTAGSGNWSVDGNPTHKYTTNEKVVGVWIDGKPLYECTISVDNPTKLSTGGKYYYDVIYNRNDIEYAQLAFCSVYDSVDGRWFPLPYQRIISSENIDILAQARADGSFQVTAHFATSAWYNLTKIRYTVQYTKTTD